MFIQLFREDVIQTWNDLKLNLGQNQLYNKNLFMIKSYL